MKPGSLEMMFPDRALPTQRFLDVMTEVRGITAGPFAKVALKNHQHSMNNPYSQFQNGATLDEVLSARTICEPLTLLQCSPTSDGSAAAVVTSERFIRAHNLEDQAVEILGRAMVTDFPSTWDEKSIIKLVGSEVTIVAARRVYDQAGLGPEDVDVIELHDCFSTNEFVMYEALGLCAEGQGGKLLDEGATD